MPVRKRVIICCIVIIDILSLIGCSNNRVEVAAFGIVFSVPEEWKMGDQGKDVTGILQFYHGECDDEGSYGDKWTVLLVSSENTSDMDEELTSKENFNVYAEELKRHAQEGGEEVKDPIEEGEINGMPVRIIKSINPENGSTVQRTILLHESEIISFTIISTIPEDISLYEQILYSIKSE